MLENYKKRSNCATPPLQMSCLRSPVTSEALGTLTGQRGGVLRPARMCATRVPARDCRPCTELCGAPCLQKRPGPVRTVEPGTARDGVGAASRRAWGAHVAAPNGQGVFATANGAGTCD